MPKRYGHNLSHYHLLTMQMGELIPVGCVEVLPGDTFRHATSMLARVAPLVAPVMHPVQVQIHHFFVPNRIVWNEKVGDDGSWEDFITGAASPTFPTVTPAAAPADTELLEHMGVPPETGNATNALPVRAYNHIWNEYYRDQDIDTEVSLDQLTILHTRWKKDYFTSARTAKQQGTAVTIPLSAQNVDVQALYQSDVTPTSDTYRNMDGTARASAGGRTVVVETVSSGGNWAGNPPPYVDMSSVTGVAIDDLRNAVALQRIAEARALYGERYVDYLRFLGVDPRDGRLSRGEYLGGGRATVAFSEVLSTAEGATVDVGELFGHGIVALKTRPYRKFFEEHGHVISLAMVRPKSIYVDAVPRNFLRSTKEDYWQRELEIMPWQEITKKEIYYPHGNTTDIFGYSERFRDYREVMSFVSGDFRNSASNIWHMARDLSASPSLNSSFLECVPTTRVYADAAGPQLYCMANHNLRAMRLVGRPTRPRGLI